MPDIWFGPAEWSWRARLRHPATWWRWRRGSRPLGRGWTDIGYVSEDGLEVGDDIHAATEAADGCLGHRVTAAFDGTRDSDAVIVRMTGDGEIDTVRRWGTADPEEVNDDE